MPYGFWFLCGVESSTSAERLGGWKGARKRNKKGSGVGASRAKIWNGQFRKEMEQREDYKSCSLYDCAWLPAVLQDPHSKPRKHFCCLHISGQEEVQKRESAQKVSKN
jgi:hypothetical protein